MSSSGDHAEVLAKPDTFRGLEWDDFAAKQDGAAADQPIRVAAGSTGDASVSATAHASSQEVCRLVG